MSEGDQLIALSGSLKSTGSKYAQVSNELVATLTFLSYIVASLQTTWKGNAPQSFMNAWDRGIRDGAYLSEALASASTAMQSLASAIDSHVGPIADLPLIMQHEVDPAVISKAKADANTARAAITSAASAANSTLGGLISTVGVCSNGQGPLPPRWERIPNTPMRYRTNADGSTTIVIFVEGKGPIKFNVPPGGMPPRGMPPGSGECGPEGWPKYTWILASILGGALANTAYQGESWLQGQVPLKSVLGQLTTNTLGSAIAGGATLKLLKEKIPYCGNNAYALALGQAFIGGVVGGTFTKFVLQPYVMNPIFGAPKPKKTPKPKALLPGQRGPVA